MLHKKTSDDFLYWHFCYINARQEPISAVKRTLYVITSECDDEFQNVSLLIRKLVQKESIHSWLSRAEIPSIPDCKRPDRKKKKTQIELFITECLHAALLLSIPSSTQNQFAPFRINCVQFPRICLFHSLQMRLWTNRVTLKISIANPFLDAWQSLCIAHKVEHKSHLCTVWPLTVWEIQWEPMWIFWKLQFVFLLCQVMNIIPYLHNVSYFRCCCGFLSSGWHGMRSQFGGCIQYGSTKPLPDINTLLKPDRVD